MEFFLDAVEKGIVVVLKTVANECRGKHLGDKVWTQQIKRGLGDLAAQHRYQPYASDCGETDAICGGEWLYDMVWLVMEGKHVRDVGLILESEWDRKGLMDDFPKLPLGRSAHRLFVFQAHNDDEMSSDIETFKNEIELSRLTQPRDRYLFACWNWARQEFYFELYVT